MKPWPGSPIPGCCSGEEDPFALGARGLRHQHIQFGNGSFDPLLMVDVSRNFGRVDFSAYAQTQLTLYENRKGFQAGNRFFTGVQAGTLVIPRLTAAIGVDLMSERPERWGGEIEQDGNLQIAVPGNPLIAVCMVKRPPACNSGVERAWGPG
jgi:hypothetical protein